MVDYQLQTFDQLHSNISIFTCKDINQIEHQLQLEVKILVFRTQFEIICFGTAHYN